jgi:hypothetical protein
VDSQLIWTALPGGLRYQLLHRMEARIDSRVAPWSEATARKIIGQRAGLNRFVIWYLDGLGAGRRRFEDDVATNLMNLE